MFCNNCGTPLEEGALFCPKCGTKFDAAEQAAPAVQTPVVPATEKKKFVLDKKWISIIGIAAVLVVAVILIFVFAGSGSGKYDKLAENRVDYYYGDDVTILFNSKGETEELDGYTQDEECSADGSVLAYTLYEDDIDVLYYTTADLKPVFVAEDVYNFAISYDGAYIAYIQDINDEWTAGDLYLYSIKDGKETKIDKDVYYKFFVLSPNGKNVAYWKNFEGYNDNDLVVAGISDDPKKIDKDGSMAVGVTDSGKVYYMTDNDKLYYFNGKDSVKIASDVYGNFYFNNDLSELIYEKNDKLYYYTPKMKEAAKISSNYLYDFITPVDMAYMYFDDTAVLGKETLKNSVLATSNGLYWFDNKGKETQRIVSNYYDCLVSSDGETIVFTKDGNLYRVSGFGGDIEPEVLYKDDFVDGVVANADLSKIYIVVDDDELYYIKNANKNERITNDLDDGIYSVAYSYSMDKVVFMEDDTLCCAGTTEKSKEVLAEEVYDVYNIQDMVIYEIYDDDEYETTYYLLNGKQSIELFID